MLFPQIHATDRPALSSSLLIMWTYWTLSEGETNQEVGLHPYDFDWQLSGQAWKLSAGEAERGSAEEQQVRVNVPGGLASSLTSLPLSGQCGEQHLSPSSLLEAELAVEWLGCLQRAAQ